jgi:hypothetical protein
LRRLYLVAAALALLSLVHLWDPDVWWHLATGRFIVEHHALPTTDPFSFTLTGAPWRAVDWLAELILYGAWRAGGALGLGLLTVLCAFGMLAFTAATLRELEVERAPSLATLTTLALLVQIRYSMARPMMLGAVLLCLEIWLCVRFWRRGGRAILWVPLSIAPWIAIHPTAIIGVAVTGVLLAASLAVKRERAVGAAIVFATATLVLLAIPAGRGLVATATGTEGSKWTVALTLEWARPTLGDPRLWIPAVLAALALAAGLADWRRHAFLLGLWLLAIALASRFQRNSYEALLLIAPLIGIAAQRAFARRPATIAGLVALAAVHLVVTGDRGFNRSFGPGVDERMIPTDTLDVLRAAPPGRLVHDCTLGGWLIWQRIPVYCDGRTVALYRDPDIERLFLPLYRGGAALEQVVAQYHLRYALARRDSDFERNLTRSNDWLPLAYDPEHALFVRRSDASGTDPIDEVRFDRDEAWLRGYYDAVAADPQRRARLVEQFARGAKRSPQAATLHRLLAHLDQTHPDLSKQIRDAL